MQLRDRNRAGYPDRGGVEEIALRYIGTPFRCKLDREGVFAGRDFRPVDMIDERDALIDPRIPCCFVDGVSGIIDQFRRPAAPEGGISDAADFHNNIKTCIGDRGGEGVYDQAGRHCPESVVERDALLVENREPRF